MHRQNPPRSAPVVLKLGGSLLGLPDLRQRLEDVCGRYARSPLLLVVGGGTAADLVRTWDRVHQLGDEIAHQLALEAMTMNGRFVSALLPNAELVDSLSDCTNSWDLKRLAIVNAAAFVPSLEATSGEPLTHTWEVTSDSLSAWIAGWVMADRLVLLKSVDCPSDGTFKSQCDAVDPEFVETCRRVECTEWINLRAESPEPCVVRFR